nr:MAG TPA: hypothetical protein [Caudoviricetes sp.]
MPDTGTMLPILCTVLQAALPRTLGVVLERYFTVSCMYSAIFRPTLVRNEAQSYYAADLPSYWNSIHAGCLARCVCSIRPTTSL